MLLLVLSHFIQFLPLFPLPQRTKEYKLNLDSQDSINHKGTKRLGPGSKSQCCCFLPFLAHIPYQVLNVTQSISSQGVDAVLIPSSFSFKKKLIYGQNISMHDQTRREVSWLKISSTCVFAWPKLDGAKDISIPPTRSQKSLSPRRCLHLFPKITCTIGCTSIYLAVLKECNSS